MLVGTINGKSTHVEGQVNLTFDMLLLWGVEESKWADFHEYSRIAWLVRDIGGHIERGLVLPHMCCQPKIFSSAV